tara:strand:- start:127 stop:423 length:297 start_codon:yes stop_codon:yes gene_type:complete
LARLKLENDVLMRERHDRQEDLEKMRSELDALKLQEQAYIKQRKELERQIKAWRERCEREEAEHQAQLTKLANAMNHSDKDLKIRELERQIALMEVTN